MTHQNSEPYDFSEFDRTPLNSQAYNAIASDMHITLAILEQQAWQAAEVQPGNDLNEYYTKYVQARWRSVEFNYAVIATRLRRPETTFRKLLNLTILLTSTDLEEDLLEYIQQLNRDDVLTLATEASKPWIDKYGVRLTYDSDLEGESIGWKIFIDSA